MKLPLRILLALTLACAAAWCAAALHYGPAHASVAAVAMAMVGAAAVLSAFVLRLRRIALPVFAMAVAAWCLWWSTITPSNDRNWAPEVAILPSATFDGDLVTIHNIRNFQYRTETDFTPRYYDKTYNLDDLDESDVLASYWMGDAIAHIFVSFGFAGRDYLSISIETRKEATESYSTITGFFRNFELYYVVADERDLVGVRTNHRADPPEQVYLYRTNAPPQNIRRVFLDYLKTINDLHDHPRWYNTLTTNCTTSILPHVGMNPGVHSLSWKVLASGYAPEYVYDIGRLDQSMPFPELKKRSLVNSAAQAAGDEAPDFSQRIRAGLPDPRGAVAPVAR